MPTVSIPPGRAGCEVLKDRGHPLGLSVQVGRANKPSQEAAEARASVCASVTSASSPKLLKLRFSIKSVGKRFLDVFHFLDRAVEFGPKVGESVAEFCLRFGWKRIALRPYEYECSLQVRILC